MYILNMAEKDPKMVGMYVFVADYIAGTRNLSLQRRGIYSDLLFFSQVANGNGLPKDLDELCRLILPYEPDPDKAEELREDLIFVINNKFQLIEGRFFNERQHTEFLKSKELSSVRSKARKKKVDTVLLEQKTVTPYKDKYKDNININNTNIIELEKLWKSLSVKMRQRSSKPKSFSKFKALTEENQKLVIETYPEYCSQNAEYSVALERFISEEKFYEVQTPQSRKDEDEQTRLYILKSKYEASVKHKKLMFNLTQNQFDEAKKLWGEIGEEEKKA